MKSTKRILSAILSVVMILGCLTVGFTAQASASDLVAAVEAGGDVNWTGGNVTLEDTLVIGNGVNIDFNGAVITGPAGKVAIKVNGDATLYDGVVLADQGSYSGETGFIKALMNYKPAISVEGGNVELNCITAVGSLLRIPNSSTIEVPIGNGINANAGNVTLDNVIAIGMKALDNTNATVVVKDAILAGIYKAVNIYSKVDFGGDDFVQYETVDLLEGFLNEGVNLSANEKKYIASATNSQGDFSVGSVIVNVAKPDVNAPTTNYVDGKLNVFAVVEEHEHYGVSNRYSYTYTPDYCEIDGVEKEFSVDGAQYVASFDGLEEGVEYEAEINYDLSIKLGKKQKEIVQKAFDLVAHYIEKAPELLYRFVADFEHIYDKAEELLVVAYDVLKSGAIDGLDELLGLVYALEGQEYSGERADTGVIYTDEGLKQTFKSLSYGWSGSYDEVEKYAKQFVLSAQVSMVNNYGAIFDTDGVDGPDSVFAYFNNDTFEKTATFAESEFAKGTPGYGSGRGLLDEFDVYYKEILDRLYAENSTTEFAADGVEKAAAYVGKNWKEIYKLAENAVVVLNKAYDIVNGEGNSDAVNALLEEVLKSGDFKAYIDAFNTGVKYVNKIMDRADKALDSQFVSTYLKDKETSAYYCGKYAKKVWNIANNPKTYFSIPVEGDYVVVDLRDEDLTIPFTVKAEAPVEDVYVKVKVVGYGSAEINGTRVETATYSDEIWFKYGEDIEVKPVVKAEGSEYSYMTVDTNGNHTVVDGEVFTTKAATNLEITVTFTAESTDTQVVFMTDKALNYKFLEAQTFDAENWSDNVMDVIAPKFEGLTEKGWSLDKNAAEGAELKTLASEVAEAAKTNEVVVVYAIYEYDEYVNVGEHGKTVKFNKAPYSDGAKVYFELSIQLRDTEKKAIEAGIILTTIDNAAEMKVENAGKAGYVFARVANYDDEGYVLSDVLYTAGVKSSQTVYARGYVVWEDGSVNYTEDIVSGSVTAVA